MDCKEIRVANLKRYIKDLAHDNQREFAEKYSMNAAHLSQLVTRHRDIGDKLARAIEKKLKLEHGEMDRLADDEFSKQLAKLYGEISEDGREAVLALAQRFHTLEHPERSEANPFGVAAPTAPKKRGDDAPAAQVSAPGPKPKPLGAGKRGKK